MAGLDILNNGLRSLTGGVTKAYIQFEDERRTEPVNVTTVGAQSATSLSGKLKAAANKAVDGVNSAANAIGSLMTGNKADLHSSGNIYEVKFNPSQISFQALGGTKMQKMNYTEGDTVHIDFVTMQPHILMTVPLIFDDCERTDAFMMEKFGDAAAAARTAAVGVANAVAGSTYSVRPQVEGFIAALRNGKTRKMAFFWGNLEYKGFLETVSAEYTMFNMEGHPIRANVNLSLLLVDEKMQDDKMGDWASSYEKAFKESTSLDSAVDTVGNLLNIKL